MLIPVAPSTQVGQASKSTQSSARGVTFVVAIDPPRTSDDSLDLDWATTSEASKDEGLEDLNLVT